MGLKRHIEENILKVPVFGNLILKGTSKKTGEGKVDFVMNLFYNVVK